MKNNILEISDLYFSYNNENIFKGISFEIEEGDFVAIVGPNGAGKSTLMKLILDIIKPKSGTIKIFHKKYSELKNKNLIGYVPQRVTIEKTFPATVSEILSLKGKFDKKILEKISISNLFNKKYMDLSGGQQQRVLIAFALISKPKLLILDEPTVGVDSKTQKDFYSMLKEINKNNKITILLITHDVGVIPSVAKKVMCINHNLCCLDHAKNTNEVLKQVYEEDITIHHHDHSHHNHN